MRALIQRVKKSSVSVDSNIVSQIGQGMNILLGVFSDDTNEDLDYLVKKILSLRIFSDNEGKINLSVKDIEGEILVISQFTLCADTKKGNRPSFTKAALPDIAREMYEEFITKLKQDGIKSVQSGCFGADMQVEIINDGPVTVMIDSKNR